MKEKNLKFYYIFIIAFIILNTLSTYIVTTEKLNTYIVAVDYSFLGIVNSFIGNIFFLFIITQLISLIFKSTKNRFITLIIVSLVLNSGLFGINVFNRYYGTSFTFKVLTIFKNPAGGFGLTIIFEALRELFTYYRIILFIPLISLVIMYYIFNKMGVTKLDLPKKSFKLKLSYGFIACLLFFINISAFNSIVDNSVIIDSAKATFATQNMGLYNYLVLDLVGYDFSENVNSEETIKTILDSYNKNKIAYTNVIDGKTYSNNTLLSETNLTGKLTENLNADDKINGILKDYNLVLIHLESFNHFLLEIPEVNKHLYNFNALLEESYVFNNFYTNVGLGTSFDAEIGVLTGLLPNGTSTLGWDYDINDETKNFDFLTLPKLFNSLNYVTNSFHGNNEEFYNRINVHPNMFGFDKYYGSESIISALGYEDYNQGLLDLQRIYQHDSGMWITDRAVFDFMNSRIENLLANDEKFMTYALTMLPHTPFYYDPYHKEPLETDLYSSSLINSIDIVTLKYLNYIKYYNEQFRILLEDVNGYDKDYEFNSDSLYNYKKTAYIFYGDHGAAIKEDDINTLFNNSLTDLEIRKKSLQTISFIYVPGDNLVTKEINGVNVTYREGLLKGEQNLVRGQTDLHRTIIDLFELPVSINDYIFGVNGMSMEPTYSLDNKTLDVITDSFFASMRNSTSFYIIEPISIDNIERIKREIARFKKNNDVAMNENLYRHFKTYYSSSKL